MFLYFNLKPIIQKVDIIKLSMETILAIILALGAMFGMLTMLTIENRRELILSALISFLIAFVLVRYLNLLELVVSWF